MDNKPAAPSSAHSGGPQFQEAFACLEQILRDGLLHGHFGYTIKCEVGKNKRRQLIIEAGKSHKFTIPYDELPA